MLAEWLCCGAAEAGKQGTRGPACPPCERKGDAELGIGRQGTSREHLGWRGTGNAHVLLGPLSAYLYDVGGWKLPSLAQPVNLR